VVKSARSTVRRALALASSSASANRSIVVAFLESGNAVVVAFLVVIPEGDLLLYLLLFLHFAFKVEAEVSAPASTAAQRALFQSGEKESPLSTTLPEHREARSQISLTV
jgi:hypothetical protein